MQHGTSGASAYAYVCFGVILGRTFHRYRESYPFGRLACDLVEKYGFISSQARVYAVMGLIAFWTQPIATAIRLLSGVLSHRDRDGGSCLGLLQHVRIRHSPSPPE
jgi:predicted ATPase